MKTTLFETKRRSLTTALVATALLRVTAACGPVDEGPLPPALTTQEQAEESDNGLSFNGLSFNGLSFNGLSFNGLSFNGLSTSEFNTWFQSQPVLASEVMRYLVRCAVPSGETRSYTAPSTGQQYTWTGGLGLAPSWAQGSAPTAHEQQVVSACLAAHANKYGQRVPISVLGRRADGKAVPVAEDELKQYKWRESCFFGNLFSGEALYVGRDKGRLKPRESSSRACSVVASRGDDEDEEADATESDSTSQDPAEDVELNRRRCAPLVYVGRCAHHCEMDESKLFYTSCKYNGRVYQPLTTRMDKRNLYRCGDGICQPTEACGERNDYLTCKDDCGTCG